MVLVGRRNTVALCNVISTWILCRMMTDSLVVANYVYKTAILHSWCVILVRHAYAATVASRNSSQLTFVGKHLIQADILCLWKWHRLKYTFRTASSSATPSHQLQIYIYLFCFSSQNAFHIFISSFRTRWWLVMAVHDDVVTTSYVVFAREN